MCMRKLREINLRKCELYAGPYIYIARLTQEYFLYLIVDNSYIQMCVY